MQNGIKRENGKDKEKKRDIKYPVYGNGNFRITGRIFTCGSDNFYCSLPWNLREKDVYYKYRNNKECNMK